MSVDRLVADQDRQNLLDTISKAVTSGALDQLAIPPEIRGLRRDGSQFQLGLSLFAWREAGNLKFEAVLKDLTARDHEEAELRQRCSFLDC
jgi:hypothetical protein